MAKNKLEKKKKMNPVILFIFAIILPLLITLVIVLVALSFFDIDAIGWAKDKGSTMPVVSSFIKSEEEEELTLQIEKADTTIEKQKQEIEKLNLEINSLESIQQQQEQDIVKLENKLEETTDTETGELQAKDHVKQTAASFRKMDPERAAGIVQNLDRDAAVNILEQLSSEIRGNILEEMEPKLAAELTERLMNQS